MCCSVLQYLLRTILSHQSHLRYALQHPATPTATHCNINCNTLQHELQHTATPTATHLRLPESFASECVRAHSHMCGCARIHTLARVCVWTDVCVCVLYTHTEDVRPISSVYVYVCVYAWMFPCVCVYIYIPTPIRIVPCINNEKIESEVTCKLYHELMILFWKEKKRMYGQCQVCMCMCVCVCVCAHIYILIRMRIVHVVTIFFLGTKNVRSVSRLF